jgi:hypothetical protein
MFLALTLSLLGPFPVSHQLVTAPTASTALSAPIQLRLSDDEYMIGERAKVRVKTDRDGYLVVLRMDGQGRVRVLFPVDPDDSMTIRGGKEYEVRGRGDREAFVVDEPRGTGAVLAAISDQPFDFTGFTRGRHWDYRALVDSATEGDPEATLLDLVDRMSGGGHYDYDLARYTVLENQRTPSHARFYGPVYYDPWYSPAFSPYWGSRFRFGFGFGFGGYHPYRRHRYWW